MIPYVAKFTEKLQQQMKYTRHEEMLNYSEAQNKTATYRFCPVDFLASMIRYIERVRWRCIWLQPIPLTIHRIFCLPRVFGSKADRLSL